MLIDCCNVLLCLSPKHRLVCVCLSILIQNNFIIESLFRNLFSWYSSFFFSLRTCLFPSLSFLFAMLVVYCSSLPFDFRWYLCFSRTFSLCCAFYFNLLFECSAMDSFTLVSLFPKYITCFLSFLSYTLLCLRYLVGLLGSVRHCQTTVLSLIFTH